MMPSCNGQVLPKSNQLLQKSAPSLPPRPEEAVYAILLTPEWEECIHTTSIPCRDWQRRLRPNKPAHPEAPSQNTTETLWMSSWRKPEPSFPLIRHGIMP